MRFPQPEWRPVAGNPDFLGVFRWNILRKVSDNHEAIDRRCRQLTLAAGSTSRAIGPHMLGSCSAAPPLLAAAPGLSQGESEPYFALSSNRTFASNGKPAVELSACERGLAGVPRLPRRGSRQVLPADRRSAPVRRPRAPAPPRERTLLERIHGWKRGLRANIRRSLRAQFTESPSAHLVEPASASTPAKPGDQGTHYAETPRAQLAATGPLLRAAGAKATRAGIARPSSCGVKEKGVYLVEAVRHDLRAYTILMVSDIVMITKTGKGRIVNLVVDRNTGEPRRAPSSGCSRKRRPARPRRRDQCRRHRANCS